MVFASCHTHRQQARSDHSQHSPRSRPKNRRLRSWHSCLRVSRQNDLKRRSMLSWFYALRRNSQFIILTWVLVGVEATSASTEQLVPWNRAQMALGIIIGEQILGRTTVELDQSREFAATVEKAMKWNETAEMGAFVHCIAGLSPCWVIEQKS